MSYKRGRLGSSPSFLYSVGRSSPGHLADKLGNREPCGWYQYDLSLNIIIPEIYIAWKDSSWSHRGMAATGYLSIKYQFVINIRYCQRGASGKFIKEIPGRLIDI
jgi:hypothetical protein